MMKPHSLISRVLRRAVKSSVPRNIPRGPHLTRYVMYEQIVNNVPHIDDGVALSIGGSLTLTKELCSDTKISEANYPDQSWLCLPYPDNTFDLVVSDQVLEHVAGDPQQAIDESYRVTKPGGIVVHTTCLMNGIHNHPGDYWRFTLAGLELLHHQFSQIIACDGWGNSWVQLMYWLNLRFEPIPKVDWHPLNALVRQNNPLEPIVVWIVARK